MPAAGPAPRRAHAGTSLSAALSGTAPAPRVHGMPGARTLSDIEALAAIDRESASDGEARAARALAAMLTARGLQPALEHERAVGGFWQSNGLAAAAAVLAGSLGGRSRAAGAAIAGLAAGLIADDVDNAGHLLRRVLPKRETTNVLAWAGDQDARETVVLVAHHDAAHTGLLFHPGLIPFVNRIAPGWYQRQNTSTQTGRLLVLGPALVALGCATGNRAIRRAGMLWSTATALLLADVARSPVVPGANDNLSAVAVLLELAEHLTEDPAPGVRVLLLSTGSEESFMEGMRGFIARHRVELDPASTRFLALECVGSPRLVIMEGEGMLRIREHDSGLREELQAAADEAGIGVWRGLRLGAGGTDALPALRAGYRVGVPRGLHGAEGALPTITGRATWWRTLTFRRSSRRARSSSVCVRRVGRARADGRA